MDELSDNLDIYIDYSPYFALLEKGPVRKAFVNKLGKVPLIIRGFIVNTATAEYFYSLVTAGALKEEQAIALSAIVRQFVIGDIFIKDLANTISTQLKIDQDSTNKLINRLIAELLLPLMEDVKNIQKQIFENRFPGQTPKSSALTQPIVAPPNMPEPDIKNKNNIINLRN